MLPLIPKRCHFLPLLSERQTESRFQVYDSTQVTQFYLLLLWHVNIQWIFKKNVNFEPKLLASVKSTANTLPPPQAKAYLSFVD